jgi:D-3-phosphoglycerate dehydrogenase / 2-oxoglutarate reductase
MIESPRESTKQKRTSWRVVYVNPRPDFEFDREYEALHPLGVEIEPVQARDDAELLAVAADADVVVPSRFRIGATAIAGLDRCRLIPSGGIGVEHIDVAAATAKGILVTNMADTFVEEVANQTWMLLLNVARRGLWLHEMATTNRWTEALDQLFPVLKISMPRITGQTLGLIAFGAIARAVARRAQAFGMDCVAYDPFVSPETFRATNVESASLEDVLRRADVVSCHMPLNSETLHLIGEKHFRLMKPSAIFLNTGRGKVVDEPALIAALQEGRIAGAGLDVLEQEPPDPSNPLLKMPNVILSPHMASVSDVSYVERRRLIGRQIADVLQGRTPVGVVNREVLANWRFASTQ